MSERIRLVGKPETAAGPTDSLPLVKVSKLRSHKVHTLSHIGKHDTLISVPTEVGRCKRLELHPQRARRPGLPTFAPCLPPVILSLFVKIRSNTAEPWILPATDPIGRLPRLGMIIISDAMVSNMSSFICFFPLQVITLWRPIAMHQYPGGLPFQSSCLVRRCASAQSQSTADCLKALDNMEEKKEIPRRYLSR